MLVLEYLAGMVGICLDPSRVGTAELTSANLAAAKRSADESQVLLENHNGALPLSASSSLIAVVGPLGNAPLDQLVTDVPIGYDTSAAALATTDEIITVSRESRSIG